MSEVGSASPLRFAANRFRGDRIAYVVPYRFRGFCRGVWTAFVAGIRFRECH